MYAAVSLYNTIKEAGEVIEAVNAIAKAIKPVVSRIKRKEDVDSEDLFAEVNAELDNLRKTVGRLNALFIDARKRVGIPETTLRWLADLKDVCIDAEDLIDELDTYYNIEIAEKEADAPSSSSSSSSSFSRKRKRQWPLFGHQDTMKNIKKIQEKYRAAVERLQLSDKDGATRNMVGGEDGIQQRSALLKNSLVVGVDDDKRRILNLVLNQETETSGAATGDGAGQGSSGMGDGRSEGTSTVQSAGAGSTGVRDPVIAITGSGGIGKTTLVRLVYNDPEVEDYLKIWINITREHDVPRITKEIIESIEGSSCKTKNFDVLQQQLKKMIDGKKFLLVLDGVWCENFSFWETLLPPLLVGAKGSAVLVSSQSQLVMNNVRPMATIQLTGLNEDDSWSLFRNHAFGPQGDVPRLKENIGKEIVRRCHGSPLAIISLGELLYMKNDDVWHDVQNYMSDPQYEEKGVLSTLKISYSYLPYHLQQCLAFCHLFPNGYEFDKDELAKLWTAVGLINNEENKAGGSMRTPENIGRDYFEYLRGRAFFQAIGGGNTEQKKYKMPGLVHELVENVCDNVFLRIENNRKPPRIESKKALYALLYDCTLDRAVLSEIKKSERLRALYLWNLKSQPLPDDLFLKFNFLRALYLGNQDMAKVPSSIGDLIHPRYLNLEGNKFTELPDSVTNLFNLQVLELGNCESPVKLPNDLRKLINLRHLGLHLDWEKYSTNPSNLIAMPSGISRLTSLQTLSRFVVSRIPGECSNIKELKDLKLRGELCISKMDEIVDKIDAEEANLRSKCYLKSLMLQWTCNTNPPNRALKEIMEKLLPPRELKSLWIMNYPGNALPSWLEDGSFYIETLRLSNCRRLNSLPLLGRLPVLKNLCIESCHELGQLPDGLNSLGKLDLKDCPKLPSLQE